MTLDIYRSINGLGTRVTGDKVRSYVPWIEDDQTQCIRVDDLCHKDINKYILEYDADNTKAWLYAEPPSVIGISSATELALIGVDTNYPLSGTYYLVNDITPSGDWTPLGIFTGTLDGKGHTISGLVVDRPANNYNGLFSRVSGGTVRNLTVYAEISGLGYCGAIAGYATTATITDCTVSATVAGSDYVGGIVGYCNGSTITGCVAAVNLSADDDYVGGIAGRNNGTITSCEVTGVISGIDEYAGGIVGFNTGAISLCVSGASVTSDNTDGAYTGGAIGYQNTGGTVENSYAYGTVTGNSTVGGFIGRLQAGIATNCYSRGAVLGNALTGGFCGVNSIGTITSCYYDSTIAGQSDTGKGTGYPTINMLKEATFVGWDFDAIWGITEAAAYPWLLDSSLNVLALDTPTKVYDGDYWVEITRIATGTSGAMVIRPVLCQNNDIGMSDQTDPSGAVTYRAMFLYNNTGATATINTIACASGWKVYLAGSAAETTVTIADEETAPTGPTFAASITPALSLAAGAFVPMWLERTVDAAAGEHIGTVTITYNTTSTVVLSGAYVTKDTSIPPYYLYYVIDATGAGATTIDNADNVATPDPIASLPHTVDMGEIQDTMHGLGTDTFVIRAGVRAVTTAGAQSQNQLLDYALHLDYTSGDITAPNAPTIDTVEYLDGGQVRVVVDHDQSGATVRAKKLTATIGAESITKLLSGTKDDTETEFIFQTPVTWGSSVTVSVVAVDASGRTSAADTDTGTAYYEYGDSTGYGTIPAAMTGASPDYAEFVSTESFGDVSIIAAAGMTSISCNGVSVFTAQTAPHASTRLHTLALTGGTITAGACTDPIEPVSTTEFYLCAGGSRVAAVDLTAGTLTCPVFNDTTVLDCPLAGPYQEIGNYVYWQYFDLSTNRWKPFMIVDKTGTAIHFIKNVECI